MTRKALVALLLVVFAWVGFPASVPAQDSYQGKTIRIIVGYRAGGGYDTYTRMIARHMDKHIPGKPNLIVENMPGAGSMVAANYLFNRAKPDGLTIGVFASGMVREDAFGNEGVQFKSAEFGWIGAPTAASATCAVMGFTGLKTWEDVRNSKKDLNFGSTGPGASTHDTPILIKELAGAPIKLIKGYDGTSAVRAAMQRKELDGACWTWESMKATATAMLNAKGDDQLIPFLIEGKHEDPAVKNAVQFTDILKDEEDLSIYKGYVNAMKFYRPLALAPNTPKDRVATLRTAFNKTLEDPQLQAAAKKAKLDMTLIKGEEVDQLVDEILSMSPKAKERLKAVLTGD